MAKGKGEIKGWITKNGVHIPIYGEYTVRGGVEPKAKGAKFKGKKKREFIKNPMTGKMEIKRRPDITEDFKKGYDEESKETWYEGKVDGHRVRVLQEEVGSNKYWNVEVDGEKLRTDNNRAMSFDNFDDASDEIAHELSQKSSNSTTESDASKGKRVEGKGDFAKHEDYTKNAGQKKKWQDISKAVGDYDANEDTGSKYLEERQNQAAAENAAEMRKYSKGKDFSLEDYERRQQEKASKKIEAREQSFRDKKAQEQGFADDASMRSYNEETGVNRETWEEKKKPTSFQEQVNDRFKTKREWDEIAKNAGYKDSSDPEFQKNADDIVAKNKQAAKDEKEAKTIAAISGLYQAEKAEKNSGRDYAINKAFEREKASYENYFGKKMDADTESRIRERISGEYDRGKLGDDGNYKTAEQKLGFKPGKAEKSSTEKLMMSKVQAQAEEADVRRQRTSVKKARASYKESNTQIANGEHTVNIQTDGTKRGIANAKKSITKAAKKNDVNYGISEHKGVVSGSRMAENGATLDSNIRSMSVSGLKQAYNTATGTAKSKIRAELRRLGYTYVGGKWVKGK